MTLVKNRADRVHARRAGALARLDNGHRAAWNDEQIAATAVERDALERRTAAKPTIRHTRKKLRDLNCSAARKAHRSGKFA